jgi:hypothetical protein
MSPQGQFIQQQQHTKFIGAHMAKGSRFGLAATLLILGAAYIRAVFQNKWKDYNEPSALKSGDHEQRKQTFTFK